MSGLLFKQERLTGRSRVALRVQRPWHVHPPCFISHPERSGCRQNSTPPTSVLRPKTLFSSWLGSIVLTRNACKAKTRTLATFAALAAAAHRQQGVEAACSVCLRPHGHSSPCNSPVSKQTTWHLQFPTLDCHPASSLEPMAEQQHAARGPSHTASAAEVRATQKVSAAKQALNRSLSGTLLKVAATGGAA